ncbi:DNA topoisomerase (ATP-hydrolyzing) subunit A [Candidatus Similichlamydia laticola]|uniref:DNA topoisomerase (ATP-hydrolyzing) n=1 Tax=Candidatus Similichlamydia laticola TaxID=2170265 RepID=A0A369KIB5_9BACT|nr:DNA topoisomerase (ATP-hydrolyzing) subunit A [Candidatus Similichlamydia laticola]RDB31514.1 DNA gyrase subunit A [Candidatus Similichlamydia laticola]
MTTEERHESIVLNSLENELRENYMRYSMSVIISRALPDVRDGLKPSQRRILYAMKQLSLGPSSKHRKCAKISGDTSGDYHPHGEQVIYPTLVRMAQSWSMRYRLIDGQGNFGSIDGDAPAAMRYTEARMTQFALFLMEDLDKHTVDMLPNYDETTYEPSVLPAKIPNLLANGSSGIAVGMATNIPPHHLGELARAARLVLEKGVAVPLEDILAIMPGPDFPTGGLICGHEGIHLSYRNGRGKIIVRAKYHFEETSSDRTAIVIEQLPYGVNKSRLVEQIAHLVEEKQVTAISDIRDESDKDGIRVVVDVKRGESAEVVVNQLWKLSDMQVTFGCSLLVLDRGMPRTLGIREIIQCWIEHRIEVIRRRSRFELGKAEERAHLLEGYIKVIEHLDQVIRLIKESPDKENAIQSVSSLLQLSKKQAQAILDLRLYQLTSLEKEKIYSEHANLLKKISCFQNLLSSTEAVKDLIKEELIQIEKLDSAPRRTEIVANYEELSCEDLLPNDPIVVTVSTDDYLKRMPIATFRQQRRGGHGVSGLQLRNEDESLKDVVIAMSHDHLLVFTNFGRCYWLRCWQIAECSRRSRGKPLIQILEDLQKGECVAAMLAVSSFDLPLHVLLCTKMGIVKKTELASFNSRRRKGVTGILIGKGDVLISAKLVPEGDQVMLFTKLGMAVRFAESEIRAMGRATRGVRGVRLRDHSDQVVGCEVVSGFESVLVVCKNGFGKRSPVSSFRHASRGGIGVRSIVTSERNGEVVSALKVSGDDDSVLIMTKTGHAIRIRAGDVRIMGRNTQGVRLAHLKENDPVVAVQRTYVANVESS